MTDAVPWRRCSACKSPIALGADYYACSVSTCNRARTALVFCSVSCWEVHLPGANHREAWAVERTAPRKAGGETSAGSGSGSGAGAARRAERRPRRRIVPEAARSPAPAASAASTASTASAASAASAGDVPREVLVVASRLKEYVRARSGCNTSDRVLEPLSDLVRRIADEAIQNAIRDGRRTVLDRDVPKG